MLGHSILPAVGEELFLTVKAVGVTRSPFHSRGSLLVPRNKISFSIAWTKLALSALVTVSPPGYAISIPLSS